MTLSAAVGQTSLIRNIKPFPLLVYAAAAALLATIYFSIAMIFVLTGGLLLLALLYRLQAQNEQLRVQHAAAVEQAKRLESLARFANDAIVVSDENGTIVEANERAEKDYGYSREELLGMKVTGLRDAAEDPAVFNGQLRQLQAAGALRYETRSRRKDGTIFPAEASARLIEVAGKKYIQDISRDVSQQQLAYEALRRSAAEIEDLYNNAPCGYHSLNADGVIIRVNDTELAWLGYRREEVIGHMRFTDMLVPAEREAFRSNFERLRGTGPEQGIEYELMRKDGTCFPVLLNATAVYDADGRFVMSRTTLFDISAHMQAEKRLAESEERFRTMADNAPNLIWMANATEQPGFQGCNFFNQRWHDFTGLSLAQTQGCSWLDSVHPEDRARCLEAYCTAFEQMIPFKLEYRLRRHDGIFRWLMDSGVPRFTPGGGFLGLIGSCIDITDHKLFEEVRAEMEHVGRLNIAGEMVSSLAHELSQPLSAANNYLDASLRRMEKNNWDKEGLHKSIKHAYIQTERAGAIINHLKNLVRKQKQERSTLEINVLIKETVGFMEYELQQHFIQTALELSALPTVQANRIEIEQVLINLIKNAIDSMASAERRELRITTRLIESGAIMVSVRDSGKGIAAAELDKVFNPFQTSKPEGLGLGLSICRSMIENYGGQIWAEQNGGGAEFKFTIPA